MGDRQILLWLLLVVVTFVRTTKAGHSQVEAVVGSTAELACITTAPTDDLVQLILWYRTRDATGPPFYTVDSRNSSLLEKAAHKIAPQYMGRVFFTLSSSSAAATSSSSQPSILSISPVRSEDAGDYSCRVDYKWARTCISSQRLFVIVPPSDVFIAELTTGKRANMLTPPYLEGSKLQLSCSAIGGKPAPSLTWYMDNQPIDTHFVVHNESSRVENILTINNLSREHLYSVLTCRAHNHETVPAISASTRLDLYTKPSHVEIIRHHLPIKDGQKLEMQCQANGSKPASSIFWYIGDEQLKNTRSSLLFNDQITFSTVSFTPMPYHNGLPLICKAFNPKIPEKIVTDQMPLDIHFIPEVDLVLDGNRSYALVLEQVKMRCNTKANPEVDHIQWLFQDQPLEADTSKGISISNYTLTINVTSPNLKGSYQCLVNNSEGSAKSNPLNLQVYVQPDCQKGSSQVIYEAAIGDVINISCPIEVDLERDSFWWKFIPDSWLTQSDSHLVVKQELSSHGSPHLVHLSSDKLITFQVDSSKHYGILVCGSGHSKENCSFRLTPTLDVPSPPEKCHLSQNSSESVYLIECSPSTGLESVFDNGHGAGKESELKYFLEIYGDRKRLSKPLVLSDQRPRFKISLSELPSNESNIFVLYAQNGNGKSSHVQLSTERHLMLGSEANLADQVENYGRQKFDSLTSQMHPLSTAYRARHAGFANLCLWISRLCFQLAVMTLSTCSKADRSDTLACVDIETGQMTTVHRCATHRKSSAFWPLFIVISLLGLIVMSSLALRLTKRREQRSSASTSRSFSPDEERKKKTCSPSSKLHKISPKSSKIHNPDVIPLNINSLGESISYDKKWNLEDSMLIKAYASEHVNMDISHELSTKLHVQLLSNELSSFNRNRINHFDPKFATSHADVSPTTITYLTDLQPHDKTEHQEALNIRLEQVTSLHEGQSFSMSTSV